jgi:hypothetical protein
MKRIFFTTLLISLLSTALIISIGCNSNDAPAPDEELNITGVSIPTAIEAVAKGPVTITGQGFKMGDQMKLTLTTDESRVYLCEVTSVTETSFTFSLPEGVTTGKYRLTLVRGGLTLALGATTLTIVANIAVPDKPGMNIKGVVYSNETGIPGVVVSDGYEVTVTDANGFYYLASEKKTGYVFISVPGNYEVPNTENAPQFFKRLSGGSAVEQKDFPLSPVNNEKHVVVAMADMHLANRTSDLAQFGAFLTDVNSVIGAYKASGAKVYGLTLGDQTWDAYWYSNNFTLTHYLTWMNKIDCPVFNIIGNHDNDPYYANDWQAEQAYRNIIGPTYYSFNLGKVHYVVLDDIEYVNTGGAAGVVGERNYNDRITADQIAWLKKDLATITDKSTPVVVAMHIPLYRMPNVSNNASYQLVNGAEFTACLAGFSKVHVLSGHTHINYSAEPSAAVMEHNVAAVCATWWWTGHTNQAGNHICKDGSVGGYAVWEINDKNLQWHYKSIGYDKNYQFRTYDLNTIQITPENYAPSANTTYAAKLPEFAGSYANANSNNEVLINVWGYDKEWTIEVSEGATPLPVTRVSVKDPLHIISYEAKRLNANADPTSSFVTDPTSHIFKVTASSPSSTLNIKVTDRFGNIYTETMTRPKTFNYTMQ